jgi:hypothetical protein
MKKIILTVLLVSTTLLADLYVGLGFMGGLGNRQTSLSDANTSLLASGYSLHAGYIFDSENRIQFSTLGMSSTVEETGEGTVDYNVDEFNWAWTINVSDTIMPFMSLGFGSGTVTISDVDYDAAMFGLGAGVFVNFGEIELEASVTSRIFGYEVIGIGVNDTLTTSHLGLKYRF